MSVVKESSFSSKLIKNVARKSTTKPPQLWRHSENKDSVMSKDIESESGIHQDTINSLKLLNGDHDKTQVCLLEVNNKSTNGNIEDSTSKKSRLMDTSESSQSMVDLPSPQHGDLLDNVCNLTEDATSTRMSTDEEENLLLLSDSESLVSQGHSEETIVNKDEEQTPVASHPLAIGLKVRNSVRDIMSKLVQDGSTEFNKILNKPKRMDELKNIKLQKTIEAVDKKETRINLFEIMSAESETESMSCQILNSHLVSGDGITETSIASDSLPVSDKTQTETITQDKPIESSNTTNNLSNLQDITTNLSTQDDPELSMMVDSNQLEHKLPQLVDDKETLFTTNLSSDESHGNDLKTDDKTDNNYDKNSEISYNSDKNSEISYNSDKSGCSYKDSVTCVNPDNNKIKDIYDINGKTSNDNTQTDNPELMDYNSDETYQIGANSDENSKTSTNVNENIISNLSSKLSSEENDFSICCDVINTNSSPMECDFDKKDGEQAKQENVDLFDEDVFKSSLRTKISSHINPFQFDDEDNSSNSNTFGKIDIDKICDNLFIDDSNTVSEDRKTAENKNGTELKTTKDTGKKPSLIDHQVKEEITGVKEELKAEIKPDTKILGDVKADVKYEMEDVKFSAKAIDLLNLKDETNLKTEKFVKMEIEEENSNISNFSLKSDKSNSTSESKMEKSERKPDRKRSVSTSSDSHVEEAPPKRSRLDIMIGKLGDQIGIAPDDVPDATDCDTVSDSEEESRMGSDEAKSDDDDTKSPISAAEDEDVETIYEKIGSTTSDKTAVDAKTVDLNAIDSKDSNDKLVDIDEKSVSSSDKSADIDEKSLDIDEKSLDIDEKSLDLDEKSLDLDEKSLDLDEKSLDMDEKSLDMDEKSVGSRDKSVDIDEKLIDNSDKSVDICEKSVDVDEKSVDSSDNSVDISDKSVDICEKSVDSSDKSVDMDEKSVDSSDKSVDMDEKSVDSSVKSVDIGEKSVDVDEKSVDSSDKSVDIGEKSVDSNEKSVDSNDKSAYIDEKSVDIDEKSVDRSNKSVDISDKSVDISDKSVDSSNKSVDSSNKSVDISDKSVDISDKSVDIIDKSVDIIDKSVDSSNKSVDNSDKSVDNSDKSVDNSDKSVGSSDQSVDNKIDIDEKSTDDASKDLSEEADKISTTKDNITMTTIADEDDDDVTFIESSEPITNNASPATPITVDKDTDLEKLIRKRVLDLIKSYKDESVTSMQKKIDGLAKANEKWKNTAKDLQKKVLELTVVQHRLDKRKAATAALKIITSRTIGCQVDSTRLQPGSDLLALQKSPQKHNQISNCYTSYNNSVPTSGQNMVSMIKRQPPTSVVGQPNVNNMSQLLSATAVSRTNVSNPNMNPTLRPGLTSVRNLLETTGYAGRSTASQTKTNSAITQTSVSSGGAGVKLATRTVVGPAKNTGNCVKVIDLTADEENTRKNTSPPQGKPQVTMLPINSIPTVAPTQILRPIGPGTLPPGASILLSGPSGTQIVNQSTFNRMAGAGGLQVVTVSAGNQSIRPGSLLTVVPNTSNNMRAQTVTMAAPVSSASVASRSLTIDAATLNNNSLSVHHPTAPPPTVKSLIQSVKHPAPLPPIPANKTPNGGVKGLVPPKPDLKISRVSQGIVLSWTITQNLTLYSEIASYQLFAYQEGSSPPSSNLWKKVGDVKALPLPMACTLTQFQEGNKYHFAVRALDVYQRISDFSEPSSIHLFPKSS